MTIIKEGLISRTGDLIYAFRFLKLLVTPFEKTKAFELGIIDKDGKVLKKKAERKTEAEQSAFTYFHRLVFNIKKLLGKIPGGKSVIARYGAALYLIKEAGNLTDEQIHAALDEVLDDSMIWEIKESFFVDESFRLCPGTYTLNNNIASKETGNIIAYPKDKILVESFLEPVGNVLGINIYETKHIKTNQKIYISAEDIDR
tara:strand:- start:12994 stop:13596 length:603 start_codon:yes stop_codon:yes gene_type:complete